MTDTTEKDLVDETIWFVHQAEKSLNAQRHALRQWLLDQRAEILLRLNYIDKLENAQRKSKGDPND